MFHDLDGDMPLQTTKIELFPNIGQNIIIKRNTYNQYQYPYSDCTVLEDNTLAVPLDDRSIFDRVVNTGYSYSRQLCFMVCEQLLITEQCNCSSYRHSYQVEGFELCKKLGDTLSDNECDILVDANIATITEYCSPRCPLECHRSFLTTTISAYSYGKNYFNNYLNNFDLNNDVPNNTDLSDYSYNNMIELWINYDTDSHIEVSEEPKMTGDDLLGEIGGHLHLFLGMSLMSFVEILEFLALLAWRATRSFFNN